MRIFQEPLRRNIDQIRDEKTEKFEDTRLTVPRWGSTYPVFYIQSFDRRLSEIRNAYIL